MDNPEYDVWNLILPPDSPLKVKWVSDLLNGVMVIQGEALAIDTAEFKNQLYQLATNHLPKVHPVRFTAVPYYAWANRESGPMTVWIRSLAIFT